MLITMLTSAPIDGETYYKGQTYVFAREKAIELILKGWGKRYDPNDPGPRYEYPTVQYEKRG